jgi:steroid delta-isomerase-like uncharacterized protein
MYDTEEVDLMSLEHNKAVVRRFFEEGPNKGNMDILSELVADDATDHHPLAPDQAPGIEGFRQALTALRTAFPDMQITIEDMIAEEDRVAIRVTTHGTHRGLLMGIPATGKEVTTTSFVIFRIAEGKIAERWAMGDRLGMLQQLGILPAAG